MTRRESKSAWPHIAFAAYLGVCALALVWPGYALVGERIEPYVFGLPFTFAWTVGWLLASFTGLCVYHRLVGSKG